MEGAAPSFTRTAMVQVVELPSPSTARHVTMLRPPGNTEPLAKPPIRVTVAPPQLSVAVAALKVATAEHWPGAVFTDTFGGHTMLGGLRSWSVTLNEQVAELPAPSVAVSVTERVSLRSSGVLAAGFCASPMDAVGVQLSLWVAGFQVPTVPRQKASAATVWLGGQVTVGGVWSGDITENVQVAVFPLLSLAVSVTTCPPATGVPAAGLCDQVGASEQWSLSAVGG